jgi:hypothetical protein
VNYPVDTRLKAMQSCLEDIKSEFSKAVLDKRKISQLSYAVTRAFTDMLDFEKTPFGAELSRLCLN